MYRIGVLVSGGGTNFQAILDRVKVGFIKNAEIVVVVSNKRDAYALKRAEENNIPTVVVERKQYRDMESYDKALLGVMEKYRVDLVLMAGFTVILGKTFIDRFRNRIMNIHPSLIPAFCGKGYYGLKVHEEVLKYGVKVTGATVHFVTEEPDGGPIILQKAIDVKDDDTPEVLQKRVMVEVEWKIYPLAVKLFCEDRLEIKGRKVYIK